MTDKQVKARELLYEGLDWSVGVDGMFINPKQIPYTNCLYELASAYNRKTKQLVHKKQECKKLKKVINEAKNSNLDLESFLVGEAVQNEYEQQLDQLKAKNEKLKAQLDVLEEDNKKLSRENDALYNNSLQEVKEDLVKRVWNLQTENKELAHYLACMTEQRNKANTTLQEIKEIVENMNKECFYDDFDCKDCDMKNGCTYQGKIKILQKIKEISNE